ncbi:uncharacterized protein LOC131663767 [Phymastichus coffea]|uniref:uncharacterized protein LOC131663767 n=1 Tax=Phymastichus coffea TaxID=108790 RepID=UPI00273BF041|nr:uncharacterized protein LOC131663767 [Phymastichus coffea]
MEKANARESIRQFLIQAKKASREDLDHLRKHIRELIDFRMGCFKKAAIERKSARLEKRKLRRAAANRRRSPDSLGGRKIHKGGPRDAKTDLTNGPGIVKPEVATGYTVDS